MGAIVIPNPEDMGSCPPEFQYHLVNLVKMSHIPEFAKYTSLLVCNIT